MSNKRVFSITLTICLGWMVYWGCSDNSMQPDSNESHQSLFKHMPNNKKLQSLAKSLALTFAHRNSTNILDNAVRQTKAENRERILDLQTFLGNHTSILDKVAINMNSRAEEVHQAFTRFPRTVDVYFPVDEHRASWRNADEIWVAYVPFDLKDTEIETITAYTPSGVVKNLDAGKTLNSSHPVLVVVPCEHNGQHPWRDGDASPGPISTETPCGECDGDGGGSGGGSSPPAHNHGDQEIFHKIHIWDDHENWWQGNPEIYFSYGFVTNEGIKGKTWLNSGDHDVNETDEWYTVEIGMFYWQQGYGDTFVLAVWESDGGDTWQVKSITNEGKKYGVDYKNGDDDLGWVPIHFLDPYDGHYNTGDAEWFMRWQ